MKRTDLEKLRGLKIRSRLRGTPTPQRFAQASSEQGDATRGNPLLRGLLGRQRADVADPAETTDTPEHKE